MLFTKANAFNCSNGRASLVYFIKLRWQTFIIIRLLSKTFNKGFPQRAFYEIINEDIVIFVKVSIICLEILKDWYFLETMLSKKIKKKASKEFIIITILHCNCLK